MMCTRAFCLSKKSAVHPSSGSIALLLAFISFSNSRGLKWCLMCRWAFVLSLSQTAKGRRALTSPKPRAVDRAGMGQVAVPGQAHRLHLAFSFFFSVRPIWGTVHSCASLDFKNLRNLFLNRSRKGCVVNIDSLHPIGSQSYCFRANSRLTMNDECDQMGILFLLSRFQIPSKAFRLTLTPSNRIEMRMFDGSSCSASDL